MTPKSLGNPFSSKTDLRHGADCGCTSCSSADRHGDHTDTADLSSSDAMLERAVESAIVRSVFGQSDIGRRSFMGMMGGTTVAAALASVFPHGSGQGGDPRQSRARRKRPISTSASCRSPAPRRSSWRSRWAFTRSTGSNAQVIKTAGWAVARDKSLSRRIRRLAHADADAAGDDARRRIGRRTLHHAGGGEHQRPGHRAGATSTRTSATRSSGRASPSACRSNTRCTTSCCATTSPNSGSIRTSTSRSAWCRRPRWSPTCARATSTAISRPTRSTSARSGKASASSTS